MQFVLGAFTDRFGVKLAAPWHVSRSDVRVWPRLHSDNGFSACTATLVPSLIL
jgi:hypothetical protein